MFEFEFQMFEFEFQMLGLQHLRLLSPKLTRLIAGTSRLSL